MARVALLYGLIFAGIALLLTWLDLRHSLRSLSTEIYGLCLAVIFTILGAWAGTRLTSRRPAVPFTPNEKAIRYLGISAREEGVLVLLAEGHSNKEIARLLGISPNTVKTHVASLLSKLDSTRRTQAIQKARSLEILS